tara:strand:+ start:7877 stop:9025 length:1149 start_codon:yes stop_codon:yes gene_type:complete
MNLILTDIPKFYKATLTGIFVMLFFISICHGQRGVRIGYIDTKYILENVDDYQAAQAQLEAKVQQWKTQVDQQLAKLETQKKQLDNERVLLTDELIKEREEELQIIEGEILDYQQKRFGPNGDLMIQRKQLAQPVQDQIFTVVQEIAADKKYDFIFDKSADVVMLYSADRYDISEQILRTINRTSKREQLKNKKERKVAEEEGSIVEVDNDRDERQKLIDARNATRSEALAKRKADLEAKRAARKKEVENKKRLVKEAREKARAEKTKKSSPTKVRKESTPEALDTKEQKTTLSNRDARKKELEAKKLKIEAEREKARLRKTTESLPKEDEETSKKEKTKPISDREARKKALEEKKKRILAERKEKLEALKRKRDSIKNNRK